jgi:hypothetical protein
MPKKPVALASFLDLYRTAFDSCVALWPILIIRIFYLFFNLIFLLSGIFICFMPLLKNIFDHANDLYPNNIKEFMDEIDWMNYFGDFHNLIMVALISAIGISVGCFFWAFFDAAVYSQINLYQKNGSAFSLGSFFNGGIKKMIPMIGLMSTWLLIALGFIFGFGFMIVFGVFLFKFSSWWINCLLVIPVVLISILVLALLITGAILSAAYLVDGQGVWDSVKAGVLKAAQHNGRAMWASILIILIYTIFITAFSVVFDVFSKLPFVGILFEVFELITTSVLAIAYGVYMSALSVALQLELKESK